MKKNSVFNPAVFIASSAIVFSAMATNVVAQSSTISGYLTDTRTGVARSGHGLCWRTGYWTPALASCECDKDLMPKTACEPPAAPASKPAASSPASPAKPAPAPAPAPAAQPQPAKPKPAAVPVTEKVTMAADVLFDFDKSAIKPEGRSKLDDLVGKLKAVNLEVIIAIGHTDSIGSDRYNQKLSVRRAESVKAYLISKGIAANRIYTEGKGEKQPIASNKTKDGRQKNRRVEIEVVGTRSR
ncbi:MAG: OmpA family protein [Betaproteobacteria bacterium]|nr:OmpA family protein [Betaproteobacteria bacterium]